MIADYYRKLRWWYSDQSGHYGISVLRPICWLRRYHRPHGMDARFETCLDCNELLWSRARDGLPRPWPWPQVRRASMARAPSLTCGDVLAAKDLENYLAHPLVVRAARA